MWGSAQFRNQVCGGALCVQRGGFWRFDRCSHGNSVNFVASVCSILANWGPSDFFCFPGAASDRPCFSGAGDVSTEAEVRHKRSRRQAVITRRFLPLSGQEPGPVGFGSREQSRELLEQAFDDSNVEFKMRIL